MDDNPYKSPSSDNQPSASRLIPLPTLPVTFAYQFDEDDMMCWLRFFYRHSRAGRRQRSRVILSAALIYFATAALLSGLSRSWPFAAFAFVFATIATMRTPRWFERRVTKAFKAHLDNALYAGAYGPHQIVLSDDGVREITPAGEIFVKWPYIVDAAGEGDHVFIQMANGNAAVVERESFVGPIPFEEIIPVIRDLMTQAKLQTQ